MTVEYNIQGQINPSVQIGDNIYFSLKTLSSGYQTSNSFTYSGVVDKIEQGVSSAIITVDIDKQFNPTHLCDMLDFDYKQYPKDYFSIVWASPCCTNYSVLQNCNIGRMRKGVIYTIINYIII